MPRCFRLSLCGGDISSSSDSEGANECAIQRNDYAIQHNLRARGIEATQWIENSMIPRPIPRNQLTMQQVESLATSICRRQMTRRVLPQDFLRLPANHEPAGDIVVSWSVRFSLEGIWIGDIAPDMIILRNVARTSASDVPHMYDVALTLYNSMYTTPSALRYIFGISVLSDENHDFFAGLLFPQPTSNPMDGYRVLEHDSEEYYEVMGTRIGRSVACLVLAGFRRGTRHIARVVVYQFDNIINLRFDLE
ncbi:hypothetical protein N7540_001040 [Penicillium herquei]|nr:hypothetical protein N7540_001040 [Penicillium herquei]